MKLVYSKMDEKCLDCHEPTRILILFDSGKETPICRDCLDFCRLNLAPQLPLEDK